MYDLTDPSILQTCHTFLVGDVYRFHSNMAIRNNTHRVGKLDETEPNNKHAMSDESRKWMSEVATKQYERVHFQSTRGMGVQRKRTRGPTIHLS